MLIFNSFRAIRNTAQHNLIKRLYIRFNSNQNNEISEEIRDDEYQELARRYLPSSEGHKCFIIHPYIKWGPKKPKDVTPAGQLQEAIGLINTLSSWEIIDTIAVPLETLDKKTIFGSGKIKTLQDIVRKNPVVTSIFINVEQLRTAQTEELKKIFSVSEIFDRYNIVMQILRRHAISGYAKLQVALAELPYVKARLNKLEAGVEYDTRRLIFQNREQKLKEAIKKLRTQRELLRKGRKKALCPIVAVVGYTNAGKTSLIKALTGDRKLNPRNQLFATLDVTLHEGVLPSNLNVLYVDTVGFLSNIPTNLIECFIATLEDAILADLILHVEDLSSPEFLHQRKHVLKTIGDLGKAMGSSDVSDKVISVGNKCDLEYGDRNIDFGKEYIKISATQQTGVETLQIVLEKELIRRTNRHIITLNVPIGGLEIRWLYKNSTVISLSEDPENSENNVAKVIITESQLQQFKHKFCSN